MAEDITVLLFDVDGVLVDPLAYKAGIMSSMEILCSLIGIAKPQDFLPETSEIAYMEARGIHDVWDMTNIMFALVLKGVFQNLKSRQRNFNFRGKELSQCLAEIKTAGPELDRPNYNDFADSLVDHFGPVHPPDLALKLIVDCLNNELDSWKVLFDSFLLSTRSVYESYGTRVFQNVILGSTEFETTYGLASIYEGPSLLRSKDKVLINNESISMVRRLSKRPAVKTAIYTARPSYPPADAAPVRGYSPEAEIAVNASGLDNFPVIGMGMMEWLAANHGERTEDLTKPNTTHSLSALLAALRQNAKAATLEYAHRLDQKRTPIILSELPELAAKRIRAIVFEDTISGIKPMFSLAEKLNASGFSISISAMGIAKDENKKNALASICQKVFPDVNQALAFVANEFFNET